MASNCALRAIFGYYLFSVLVLGITSFTTKADLTVVADLGGQSTADYFEGINNQSETTAPQGELSALIPMTVLPVRTPEMLPDKVKAKVLSLPGMRPMFLVGDDNLSRRWLLQHRDALGALNAVGLVVNVVNEGALSHLKKHAPELELLPVSGSDLARRLGLSHYPVLLTDKGLEQ
ncbi:integrating conjugative element protein [Yersinia bercovieri]|uniref:integrating conjugative element protein n=1 Tax=Yersinia bercovieri TaxID=634 RepID=UPI0005E24866|nr:integrating conjugative element protein [Yersinia bercovieri]MCB5303848.1 integrating conjugative element protein [Yersinia bercovieri]CFQ34421.1 integrating conjugative element protein%2C PFL_4695 family [Yersinia bercovieri]HEN3654468.1 integrating conjugative element protein [Yersinia enterocolitica]